MQWIVVNRLEIFSPLSILYIYIDWCNLWFHSISRPLHFFPLNRNREKRGNERHILIAFITAVCVFFAWIWMHFNVCFVFLCARALEEVNTVLRTPNENLERRFTEKNTKTECYCSITFGMWWKHFVMWYTVWALQRWNWLYKWTTNNELHSGLSKHMKTFADQNKNQVNRMITKFKYAIYSLLCEFLVQFLVKFQFYLLKYQIFHGINGKGQKLQLSIRLKPRNSFGTIYFLHLYGNCNFIVELILKHHFMENTCRSFVRVHNYGMFSWRLFTFENWLRLLSYFRIKMPPTDFCEMNIMISAALNGTWNEFSIQLFALQRSELMYISSKVSGLSWIVCIRYQLSH